MKNIFLVVVICLFSVKSLSAQTPNSNLRADSHAPIGVMRDHIHKKGEFMTSYRASYMEMKGLSNNQGSVSSAQALNSRLVAPIEMQMGMDMLSAMYGVTDNLTIAAMGSFAVKKMNHQRRNGTFFERESESVGDIQVNALYKLGKYYDGDMLFNLGLSIPTGSVDERDLNGNRLPYPMQIGSGSYEILPGLSYTKLNNSYSYGGQLNASFKLDTNNNGYKLGDSYNITAWIAKPVFDSLSISSRLDFNKIEAIEGRDSSLDNIVAAIVTADPSLSDREFIDLYFGVNYVLPDSLISNMRLAFEGGPRIHEKFQDNQLETDFKLFFGIQKTF